VIGGKTQDSLLPSRFQLMDLIGETSYQMREGESKRKRSNPLIDGAGKDQTKEKEPHQFWH